jgi:hypothetical protein
MGSLMNKGIPKGMRPSSFPTRLEVSKGQGKSDSYTNLKASVAMINLSIYGALEISPACYIYHDRGPRAADIYDNSIRYPGRALRESMITLIHKDTRHP